MAKFDLSQELLVQLPEKSYPVLIGYGLLSKTDFLRRHVTSKQVMIVSNDTVAPLYLSAVQKVFADCQCDCVILEDGEAYKNQQSLYKIYDGLLSNHHHRDTTLIALGGGVVGDITGFAASTYQRGARYIQLPTTLLAQVDASIGGKTAINHVLGKNMIGSFYQPDAVIIDLDTLHTLPLREFRAGLAEVIKYGLLEGGEFFERLQDALHAGLGHNQYSDLAAIIGECCRAKARIVQADEREAGMRALLNLGHTFAHALETHSLYQRWLHGEAVAIGLYCAALLSHESGVMDWSDVVLIDKMLKMAGLPARIPQDINPDDLRAKMAQDKKIKNNRLRFILMRGVGHCYIDDEITDTVLQTVLQRAVEGE
ncbi:3-dehydroquinate synthase [Legionella spiritensis]|uniref:3-dehydroquinate synthase n=1 Tax=Legionella spiritensis TaxID=452 RepID=UPI000F6B773A|nr:3-dehydroquinate synthase [Legionella spiritensis]VEG90520.1 3-dehydroquinate synthase [Legionella spiritensis]